MCYGGKSSFVTGNVQKKIFFKLHVVSPFLVLLRRSGIISNIKVGISPLVVINH